MNPFKLKLNYENKTASIIKSFKKSKDVFIPRYIRQEGQDFTIISIGENAFTGSNFESITFDTQSEVENFEMGSFHGSKIKKLEIPANLKEIEDGYFFHTYITQFEISPGNKYFSYIDNKYLVCKSDEHLTKFDLLIYTKYDLTEAVIPSTIKVMKKHSISSKLNTLIFPDDTEIECIEYGSLNANIRKLRIPKTLKKIEQSCFQITANLVDIEVSPENKNFLYVDDTFLLKKNNNSDVFNIIAFCRRDIVDVLIPSYVTKIADYAFSECKKIKSINFEPNSKLKVIDTDGFSWCLGPSSLVVPMSVQKVCGSAFVNMQNIVFVEFLSEEICLDNGVFHLCHNLKLVSFPNAKKIRIRRSFEIGNVVLVNANAELISYKY